MVSKNQKVDKRYDKRQWRRKPTHNSRKTHPPNMLTYFVISSSTRDPELFASPASRLDHELRMSCRSAAYIAMGTICHVSHLFLFHDAYLNDVPLFCFCILCHILSYSIIHVCTISQYYMMSTSTR